MYYVPENFTPTIMPHVNSKKNKPFYPTLPSTMAAIKQELSTGMPTVSVSGPGAASVAQNVLVTGHSGQLNIHVLLSPIHSFSLSLREILEFVTVAGRNM